MSSEKRYTYAEAKIIGKRALCEAEDRAHIFKRCSTWNIKGNAVCDKYLCENCDAIVTITYPELGC